MKKRLKKILVTTLTASLCLTSFQVSSASAASKPGLSSKSITLNVANSKTIKVTKVKSKKVKKTKWSVKNKKIASLSKQKKTSVKVKAKKVGSTTLTAKIKVGNKTYKKTCKIKVTKTSKPSPKPSQKTTSAPTSAPTTKTSEAPSTKTSPTPTATAPPTQMPERRELQKVDEISIPKRDAEDFKESLPKSTVNPDTALIYEETFDGLTEGTKSTSSISDDSPGISNFLLRGFDPDGPTKNDYLKVEDVSDIEDNDDKLGEGKALKCHSEDKNWQGPMMILTDTLESGCEYTVSAKIYCKDIDLQFSYQLQTKEDSEPEYGQFPTSNTRQRYEKDLWNDVKFDITIPNDKYFYGLYFEIFDTEKSKFPTDTLKSIDIYVDNFKIVKKSEPAQDKTIASLKDTYGSIFDIVGVGAGQESLLGSSSLEFLKSQYNAFTPGNEMKPDAIMGSTPTLISVEEAKELGYYIPDNYASQTGNQKDGKAVVPKLDFTTVDKILKACHDEGIKLRGHTLVWHQQTPVYYFQKSYAIAKGTTLNVDSNCMDTRLEFFIKSVLNHILSSEYSDCVYAYDVVNEYLHSAKADENDGTYWNKIYNTDTDKIDSKVSLWPSYVKDAFVYSKEVLKEKNREDIKLFYNDYNCYQYPADIVHLLDYINEDGKVCDGLGMQSHLDITDSFHSANNYATALEFFRVNLPKDIEIHITELDATMDPDTATDQQQAAYYDQIMNAILTNKKNGGNITGFILWSFYDAVSWRNTKNPCIFRGLYNPKSAFYAVIDAKENYYD